VPTVLPEPEGAPVVLIADDDAALRSALQRILETEGHKVVTAADGESALRMVRGERPDVVLLDVMMPARDGFNVCAELKADAETRLTPVVLLTALGAVEDRVRGIDAGADDFLTKPFERAELLARVRSLWRMKSYTDELERAETVLLALARSIEAKDPYTEGHCERLGAYAVALGEHMGEGPDQIRALRQAGTLHDIGKVAVPDAILLKQGPLTADEHTVMRQHPLVGERICSGLRSLRTVLPVIRHHHERRDGSGYPDGLAGDEIPLLARILQVVDVHDALTTDRPYRRALSWDDALSTLDAEVARGWWDPAVVASWRTLAQTRPALVAPH
jgi:putative two-component system response regulator